MRPSFTYANVMATVAVFIALGGASYAAIKLPKNSIGPKQLKKNSVTGPKIKNQAVTAAKVKQGTLTGAQINIATLGTVPSAQLANSLTPSENWQGVAFENGWKNGTGNFGSVAYYKDQTGVVHLRGLASEGTVGKSIFRLPPGYRPASGSLAALATLCGGCTGSVGPVFIVGSGFPGGVDGTVIPVSSGTTIGFDGVTFRAES
jgi:hypothetical protein